MWMANLLVWTFMEEHLVICNGRVARSNLEAVVEHRAKHRLLEMGVLEWRLEARQAPKQHVSEILPHDGSAF